MIVFVHGVPETAAIWDPVRALLERESVALSLPGFGCPRPDGFSGTKGGYVNWLLGELDAIDGPVDLVGHDWGALLTYRVASAHGDRIHSWAADVGNVAHPEYTWHDFAQLWQTSGEGESFVEGQVATPKAELAAGYQAMGISASGAQVMAAAFDATMGEAILGLYRSAVPNIHQAWGPWQPTNAPGLVIHATDDPFANESMATETAGALGARIALLSGAGHFWPDQAPEQAALLLEAFWKSVD